MNISFLKESHFKLESHFLSTLNQSKFYTVKFMASEVEKVTPVICLDVCHDAWWAARFFVFNRILAILFLSQIFFKGFVVSADHWTWKHAEISLLLNKWSLNPYNLLTFTILHLKLQLNCTQTIVSAVHFLKNISPSTISTAYVEGIWNMTSCGWFKLYLACSCVHSQLSVWALNVSPCLAC